MPQAPWETQTTPDLPSSQEPYLQLADPLLQRPGAFGDGPLTCQGGFKALDDPVCLLDLLLQAQSSLGSAVRKQQPVSSVSHSSALQMGSAWHSPLPIEVAQALHIVVSVLHGVEDHRQLQGSGARRLGRQKHLTLLLGCFLLRSQALKALCCTLGQGWSRQRTPSGISGSPNPMPVKACSKCAARPASSCPHGDSLGQDNLFQPTPTPLASSSTE